MFLYVIFYVCLTSPFFVSSTFYLIMFDQVIKMQQWLQNCLASTHLVYVSVRGSGVNLRTRKFKMNIIIKIPLPRFREYMISSIAGTFQQIFKVLFLSRILGQLMNTPSLTSKPISTRMFLHANNSIFIFTFQLQYFCLFVFYFHLADCHPAPK